MEELRQILNKASTEERRALTEILEAKTTSTIEDIADAFDWNAQSLFGYFLTDQRSYSQIVEQVAEKLDIKHTGLTIKDLEVKIAQKVLRTVWDEMTPEQRTQMETELRQVAQEFDKGGALLSSGSIFATLTAAKLSGFGVYLLASTSLGALTGAIGVTLPFAVYTTMSSAIATILGPPGLIVAAMFAIWKLSGPNYKRLIPAVLYVLALRTQQEQEWKERRDRWIVFIIIIVVILILAVYFFF